MAEVELRHATTCARTTDEAELLLFCSSGMSTPWDRKTAQMASQMATALHEADGADEMSAQATAGGTGHCTLARA